MKNENFISQNEIITGSLESCSTPRVAYAIFMIPHEFFKVVPRVAYTLSGRSMLLIPF